MYLRNSVELVLIFSVNLVASVFTFCCLGLQPTCTVGAVGGVTPLGVKLLFTLAAYMSYMCMLNFASAQG